MRARIWWLRATALATVVAGAIVLRAATSAVNSPAPSLVTPFALAGVGLVAVAVLMYLEARSDLVELILGGLTAGSFGVALAETSAQAATIDDHYKSLWVPAVLAFLLLSYLASRSAGGEER
jgi:hypothetical protein